MPLEFKAARTREFTALLALYGTTLTYNGVDYPCIAPPIEKLKELKPNNYEMSASADFTIWQTDFAKSGIDNRKMFTHRDMKFEVYSSITDDKEPTVELRANLKQ